jgi:hypothetical protein
MCCPISGPKFTDPRKCPHPEGYHQWVEANPWVRTLQMPKQQTPESDTESEKAMGFGIPDGPYPPEDEN